MKFTETEISGVYIIEPEPKNDHRGYFERIYCLDEFNRKRINFKIAQMNRSLSFRKGTIRGIHMQKSPKSEDKLISCIQGAVFDVVIDLREESKTFGKWIGNTLSFENKKMVFVPKDVAHGTQSLQDNTVVQYPVSEFYSPELATGIRWNDPYFKITWPIQENVIVSDIDASWQLFSPHHEK
ncbi:MAG: dTDP-4-dehydrorhamnose 3,5-epimerase [Candidatus Levyibacteriota bacterium]|nr:MAG: dTDP-4-dehydrorhamnose 3,5-epimerase [Candidatus Levybacteria bacterium]